MKILKDKQKERSIIGCLIAGRLKDNNENCTV